MWLVLCSPTDEAALWVYRGLQMRGLHPIELISPEALVYNLHLEHRLGEHGTRTSITLADGRLLDSQAICGVLNRITDLPIEHLRVANLADRVYAQQEVFALFLSWLYGLCGPVFNRPTPQGLCGAWRTTAEWMWLADQAGLPYSPYRQSSRDFTQPLSADSVEFAGSPRRIILVVAGQAMDANAPAEIQMACVRLAELAATAILGIEFAHDKWTFTGATTLPDLRLGGNLVLDALAAAFMLDRESP